MDSHRIEVFDRADDHAVVGVVAHHLQLVFLPTRDRLLDQDLVNRAALDAEAGDLVELLHGVGHAGAPTAEDVRGTDDDRQADLLHNPPGLFHVVGHTGPGDLEADLLHRDLESFTVLCRGDGLGVGSDELDTVRRENSMLLEFHREVEAGLATEGRQHRVGLLLLDDLREHVEVERLDIGRVRKIGIGHDRRGVRVSEDDAITLLLQHPAGLRARVIELAGLTDDDGTRADDQNRLDIGALRH